MKKLLIALALTLTAMPASIAQGLGPQALDERINETRDQVAHVSAMLDRKIKKVDDRLTTLHATTIGQIQTRILRIESRLDDIERRLSGVQKQITVLHSKKADK